LKHLLFCNYFEALAQKVMFSNYEQASSVTYFSAFLNSLNEFLTEPSITTTKYVQLIAVVQGLSTTYRA